MLPVDRLTERAFVSTVTCMNGGVPQAELISIQRSAAMIQPRGTFPVERDVLMNLIGEVLEQRQLLARFGADLKVVASHAPKIIPS